MIKNVVQEIGGIGLYGIISLCLFFGVFTGALLIACFRPRSYCTTMSALPLDDDSASAQKGNPSHE